MSAAEDRKSRAAEELEASLDAKQNARLEAERRGLQNLNQGMDATGHDATHSGIKWGPSYKAHKPRKSKPAPKDQK